jgi:hypothetical protein
MTKHDFKFVTQDTSTDIVIDNHLYTTLNVASNYGVSSFQFGSSGMTLFKGTKKKPKELIINVQRSMYSKQYPLFIEDYIKVPCLILVNNKTGQDVYYNPSVEQFNIWQQTHVIIGSDTIKDYMKIRPGSTAMFEPILNEPLYLYSPKGDAQVKISYFPFE